MGGTNVWDAEWEVNEEQARTLIGRQFPQLSLKQVKRLGWGWDNTVFLIGDEYVFRFPRRTIAVGSIRMEGKLLPKLEAYMTIPYPKPLFYGEASDEYPAPFLGYAYVPGDFPIGLTEERRALSAETLAKFLRRLHEFPVQAALKSEAITVVGERHLQRSFSKWFPLASTAGVKRPTQEEMSATD